MPPPWSKINPPADPIDAESLTSDFKISHVFKSVCQRIVAEHSMRVVIDNGNPYDLIRSIAKRKLNPFSRFDMVHRIHFVYRLSLALVSLQFTDKLG